MLLFHNCCYDEKTDSLTFYVNKKVKCRLNCGEHYSNAQVYHNFSKTPIKLDKNGNCWFTVQTHSIQQVKWKFWEQKTNSQRELFTIPIKCAAQSTTLAKRKISNSSSTNKKQKTCK